MVQIGLQVCHLFCWHCFHSLCTVLPWPLLQGPFWVLFLLIVFNCLHGMLVSVLKLRQLIKFSQFSLYFFLANFFNSAMKIFHEIRWWSWLIFLYVLLKNIICLLALVNDFPTMAWEVFIYFFLVMQPQLHFGRSVKVLA